MADVHGGRREAREVAPESSPYSGASPYTFEGQIDGMARFASGLRHARPGPRRFFGVALILMIFVIPLVFGMLSMLVDLVTG